MQHKYIPPDLALDLTMTDPLDGQPWDFDKPEKRDRASEAHQEADFLNADRVAALHRVLHVAVLEQVQDRAPEVVSTCKGAGHGAHRLRRVCPRSRK